MIDRIYIVRHGKYFESILTVIMLLVDHVLSHLQGVGRHGLMTLGMTLGE